MSAAKLFRLSSRQHPMFNFNSDSQSNDSKGASDQAASTGSGVELEPWLVVLGEGDQSSLAMWQLSGEQLTSNQANPLISLLNPPAPATQSLEAQPAAAQLTVALFSSEQRASDYADKCCSGTSRIVQVDRTRFLSLMVDCFRQGIRYATLNPGDSTAQSLFVLRDVLSAAKRELAKAH